MLFIINIYCCTHMYQIVSSVRPNISIIQTEIRLSEESQTQIPTRAREVM